VLSHEAESGVVGALHLVRLEDAAGHLIGGPREIVEGEGDEPCLEPWDQ
jgi:hypothetical protein